MERNKNDNIWGKCMGVQWLPTSAIQWWGENFRKSTVILEWVKIYRNMDNSHPIAHYGLRTHPRYPSNSMFLTLRRIRWAYNVYSYNNKLRKTWETCEW